MNFDLLFTIFLCYFALLSIYIYSACNSHFLLKIFNFVRHYSITIGFDITFIVSSHTEETISFVVNLLINLFMSLQVARGNVLVICCV